MKRFWIIFILFLPCVAHTEESFQNIPTSQKYVDNEMEKLQPQFAGLGENKLMTYGTTDGAVGSRDIVTQLGNSTTANSIPTSGAINRGLNTKQDTLYGKDGYVVANTGTSGAVMQKPVYSATNNYTNALVDAETLNNAVINAVNSELIQVPEGWRINTVENLIILPTSHRYFDASVKTKTIHPCYRSLDGESNQTGQCGQQTLSTLGENGNKSGLWGIKYPYGDIVGQSVCSKIKTNNKLNGSTPEQNEILDLEFSAQTGNGNINNNQTNCWCKIQSVNDIPTISQWLYFYTAAASETCANECVVICYYYTRESADRREYFFNSISD